MNHSFYIITKTAEMS